MMTEIFDLLPNSIFDTIIDTDDFSSAFNGVMESDFSSIGEGSDLEELLKSSTFLDNNMEADQQENHQIANEKSENQILQHDCMWSGTCTDKEHKTKRKPRLNAINEIINQWEADMGETYESSYQQSQKSYEESPSYQIWHENDQQSKILTALENVGKYYTNPESGSIYTAASNHYNQMVQPSHMGNCYQQKLQYPASSIGPHIDYTNLQMNCNFMNSTACDGFSYDCKSALKFEPLTLDSSVIQHCCPTIKVAAQNSNPPLLFYNNRIFTFNDMIANNGFLSAQNGGLPQFSATSAPPPPLAVDHRNNDYISTSERKKLKKYTTKNELKATKSRMRQNSMDNSTVKGKKQGPRISTDDDDDNEPIKKRSMHNSMERLRRINLKNLFIDLRHSIPCFEKYDRVPKILILHTAAEYCAQLTAEERNMIKEKTRLAKINARLAKKCCRILT